MEKCLKCDRLKAELEHEQRISARAMEHNQELLIEVERLKAENQKLRGVLSEVRKWNTNSLIIAMIEKALKGE
jgi:hypothetical protein